MMTPEEVASYLKEHPEFFENHAEMLADIYVPHPHGGRAISISERQILSLRERTRQLEGKLREIIQFGEENDAISDKVHRISLALMHAGDLPGAFQRIYHSLREDFAVPHVALRLWRGEANDLPEFAPSSESARQLAASLAHPYCSAHPVADTAALFGEEGAHLRSFAYVALREQDETFGLLVLASEDPQRFYPEMGTLYLKRLGELITAAISRYLQ